MVTVNIKQAKADFEQLVALAEAGEEIVISRGNRPGVKLVPVGYLASKTRGSRQPESFEKLREDLNRVDLITHSSDEYLSGAQTGGGFAEDGQLDLDGLPESIRANKEFIITCDGQPVARVVPVSSRVKHPRTPGALKGRFTLPDSFFDSLPEEELRAWQGAYSFDGDRGDVDESGSDKS